MARHTRDHHLLKTFFAGIVSVAVLFWVGCATPPAPRELSLEERIREDNRVGSQVSADFENRIEIRKEADVTVFLRAIAEKLTSSSPELRPAPIGVFLIRDSAQAPWKSYSLPGNRLYLSINVIKRLDFESELAALIANELAHIVNRHVVKRLQPERTEGIGQVSDPAMLDGQLTRRVEFFGPAGIFAFSDEDLLQSVETAVSLMYRAGYDPRGLVRLWERYRAFGSRSPFEPSLLARLTEKSREAAAYYAPLRNPVVRSEAFLGMKRRIERL